MKSGLVQLSVPLSRLSPSRRNPRKVKASSEAHRRLVALIRSQGLLQPLVVRRLDAKRFEVVAGERRYRALKEIHRNDGDPKIPCVSFDVDAETADAMSLSENFGREAMHPLDEAEAFAKLASGEGKDAHAVADEFGVPEHYVRQRMKLATLASPVKEALREGRIDLSTAAAFAAVPEDRQQEIWKEVKGDPQNAQHVRNVIASSWIDAKYAIFDPASLPEGSVSTDLFSERTLVERRVFMEVQAQALIREREQLLEDGWKEVVIGTREELYPRVVAMAEADSEYDKDIARKLTQLGKKWDELEEKRVELEDGDEAALALDEKQKDLEAKAEGLKKDTPSRYAEETKAVGTVFLILCPDGQVRREFRVPKQQGHQEGRGAIPEGSFEAPKPPTTEDLSDSQLAAIFTHETLAVRAAVLEKPIVRKRLLVMILHEKIKSEALAIRPDSNGTSVHAGRTEGFTSPFWEHLRKRRKEVDPFFDEHYVDDVQAYTRLSKLSESKLDKLIDVLTVELLTAHFLRPTKVVKLLAEELKVNLRDHWRPDAGWLKSYQKLQLAHLISELKGAVHTPPPERKKSELVESLDELFAEAAEGKLEDKDVAARANAWVPKKFQIEE